MISAFYPLGFLLLVLVGFFLYSLKSPPKPTPSLTIEPFCWKTRVRLLYTVSRLLVPPVLLGWLTLSFLNLIGLPLLVTIMGTFTAVTIGAWLGWYLAEDNEAGGYIILAFLPLMAVNIVLWMLIAVIMAIIHFV